MIMLSRQSFRSVLFFFPDVVRALSPTVRARLVDTVLTFESVKPSASAHEQGLSVFLSSMVFMTFWNSYVESFIPCVYVTCVGRP